jgi:O-succinylbenzoate synthase
VTTAPAPLERLAPVTVEAVEVVTVTLRVVRPLPTAARGAVGHRDRDVLLVHVLAAEAEGWAECAVEPAPTYEPEYVAGERRVLLDHVVPLALAGARDGDDGPRPGLGALDLAGRLAPVQGHHQAKAALELALLDAELRAADRSLAGWLGATATGVRPGAALSAWIGREGALAEARAAVDAGAARLRVKVGPGIEGAALLRELRDVVGPDVLLQADANGSFHLDDPAHLAELDRLDEVGLACLEQPLAAADLLGHVALAERLDTPICLDEPLTSLGAVEAALALGACEVVCLKPARVGGWVAARAVHDRCVALGVPVWVGGMLETGIGRAANAALAGLPGMALPPDLDPRPRFEHDLADPLCPVDGLVPVPAGPGTGAVPDAGLLAGARVDRLVAR